MREKLRVWYRKSLSFVVLAGFVVIALACRGWREQERSAEPAPPVQTAPPITSTQAGAPVFSYADVVSRVTPAVVTIRSARRVRPPQQHPFFSDPRFREFFGDRAPRTPQNEAPQQRGL